MAERLPDDVTAELSFDDVEAVLAPTATTWPTRASRRSGPRTTSGPGSWWCPTTSRSRTSSGEIDDAGLEITDEQVVAVLDAETRYYEAIGAIGPRVEGPDDVGDA